MVPARPPLDYWRIGGAPPLRERLPGPSSQLFGFQELPFDDSGRFVMPDHLRILGKIEDGLYFQGGGRFFTLWNPVELAQMGDDWAGAKAACASFLADAKAKGK